VDTCLHSGLADDKILRDFSVPSSMEPYPMRRAFVLLVLLVSACEGSFVRPEDLGRKVQIEKSYEARDTCLKTQAAADGTESTDPATLAHAAALACQQQTDKLIAAANTDGNAQVTEQIRQDTEFRAVKYVMRARGRATFDTSSLQP
jgi:hypothetical protein